MTLLEHNHQMPAVPSPAEHSAGEVAPLPASPALPVSNVDHGWFLVPLSEALQ